MTIYFDISAAVHRRAGLGRYAESLARELRPLLGDRLAFFYNREQGVEPLVGMEDVPSRSIALGYKPWRMLVWAGQAAHVGFNRLIPGAELFHATEHLLLPLRGVPTVLTVHDLIFRRLPQHHKPLNRWYLNLTLPLFCRRATHVIAVSEQTRRDLIAAYRLPPEKITVIQEAADPRFGPQPPEAVTAVRARFGLPDRYVLFVSTIEPRKNLIRLLAAFERVHAAGLTDALVIVGKRGWLYDDFFAALERSPARQAVIFPGYVPDADLPAVYAGSQVFAFPSLFEGFGLPVLEAMACGAPVICSNTSSLPEVAGDAALLVDPLDVDALTDALHRLLADPDLHADLARRGLAQAARFSWAQTAMKTLAVYRRLLQETITSSPRLPSSHTGRIMKAGG
ncbi:MAG: glycosyltransferase family 1 protein [Chloroflexi bacterium]|nr:glycosyltransferase family 1 protein [Chloroflexota bacterium]